MKKLLIIQTDPTYFLHETVKTLENNREALTGFDVKMLVDESAGSAMGVLPYPCTSKEEDVLSDFFDMSVNLSLNERAWDLHAEVRAIHKVGVRREKEEVKVPDVWSTYLLTLKANAPFVAFQLQDIYKNILGIKKVPSVTNEDPVIRTVVFGLVNQQLFRPAEQEDFVNGLTRRFRHCQVKDISEVDARESAHTLYIGPAGLPALRLGAHRNVILSSDFQGFNLLPPGAGTIVLTSPSGEFTSTALLDGIERILRREEAIHLPYNAYEVVRDLSGFNVLTPLTARTDLNFPLYQAHLVLWSFLLGLSDLDLPLQTLGSEQRELVTAQIGVLDKLIRLHDYAMVSLDHVLRESGSGNADAGSIEGHLKNLREIDVTFESISASHSLLRPILDYYRIRRGQNNGTTLNAQAQNSVLVYHEEHQALMAYAELLQKLRDKQ